MSWTIQAPQIAISARGQLATEVRRSRDLADRLARSDLLVAEIESRLTVLETLALRDDAEAIAAYNILVRQHDMAVMVALETSNALDGHHETVERTRRLLAASVVQAWTEDMERRIEHLENLSADELLAAVEASTTKTQEPITPMSSPDEERAPS